MTLDSMKYSRSRVCRKCTFEITRAVLNGAETKEAATNPEGEVLNRSTK